MKRIIILILSVLYLFVFSSCTRNVPDNHSDDQTDDKFVGEEADLESENNETEIEEDSACEEGLISFSSLEEFEDAIENATEGGDVADLASLDMYYLPTGIPEEYELYKITAGIADIGFWYMHESNLDSEEQCKYAEAYGQYYLFISPRHTYKFESIQEQFGVSDNELTDDYFIHESITEVVYWNKNDDALTLYLPRENEDENEVLAENGITTYSFNDDEIDISDLLTTETVIVE